MNKPLTNILKYDKSLDIRNLEQLPRGLGAKYLEVMTSHEQGVYIAVQWHRKLGKIPSDHIMVVL